VVPDQRTLAKETLWALICEAGFTLDEFSELL
jgi:hypothetical protein